MSLSRFAPIAAAAIAVSCTIPLSRPTNEGFVSSPDTVRYPAAAPAYRGSAARPEYGVGVISRQRDEFEGRTITRLAEMAVGGFIVTGTRIDSSDVSGLSFGRSRAEWRYLRCHRTLFLADTMRVEPLEPERHDGEVGRGGVQEEIVVLLSNSQLRALGMAGQARGRICNTEFTFTAAQQRTLIQFIDGTATRTPGN